ncbi:MAG: EpsI family protein [Candidatus Hydrogenedentes bacterium]|nr:EpsI family protein [Candidatus Hydrogenedentota bacterium]
MGEGNAKFAILLAFLGVSIFLVYRPSAAASGHGGVALGNLPLTLDKWTSKEGRLSDEVLATLGAKDYLVREYQSGKTKVTLYITYFDTGSGSLTHNPEKCYTASGWTFLNKKTAQIPGTNWLALQSTLARGEDRQVVVYWYQIRDRILLSKTRQVWSVVWRALAAKSTDSLVVSVSTQVGSADPETKGQELLQFGALAMNALMEKGLDAQH